MIAICLPGAAMMLAAGAMYKLLHHNYFVQRVLHSVAAAAIGLVLATTLQLGKKSIKIPWDWVILVLCIIGINLLKQMVPFVLLAVGFLSIQPHMPRKTPTNDRVCLVLGVIIAVAGFCNWIQLPPGKVSAVHDFWHEVRLYLEASRPIGWIGLLIALRAVFDLGVLKPRRKKSRSRRNSVNKRVLITSAVILASVVGFVIMVRESTDAMVLLDLAKVFGFISLLTIGGGMASIS